MRLLLLLLPAISLYAQPAGNVCNVSNAQTNGYVLTATTTGGRNCAWSPPSGGGAIPASAKALASDSGSTIIAATLQGNGAKVQLSTGTTTTNNCAKYDSNGNVVDAGFPCVSAPGLVLLEQHTVSAASSSAFTSCISSTFDDYVVKMIGLVPSASGSKIAFQFSTNGGVSYDTGTHYSWNSFVTVRNTQGPNGADAATSMNLVNEIYTAGASGSAISMDGSFEIFHPGNTTLWTTVIGQASTAINSGGTEPANWTMQGAYTTTGSAVNAFQVIPSTGTFSGTIRCYGVSK
jgi:hypothetical protein